MLEGRKPGTRVLVAQSYFLNFDPKLRDAGQPVPPIGSLICAAILRDAGHDVRFFDSMLAESETSCGEAMERERPDVLVLFEDNFNYLTKMCLERMRLAAGRIISMARERGIEVIAAGSDATDDPGFYLRAGASAVAFGEGEWTVAEWLGVRAATIAGLATLGADGSVERTRARPNMRDLDAIPAPAWDLVDLSSYRRLWTKKHGRFSLPLATSRGCPYHCNWCAKPIWGQRYNAVSPQRAAAEVLALRGFGATHVNVLDDIFGLRSDWIESFADALAEADARLPFRCLSRADLLTERTVAALARAGCEMVWIGAESGSQRILDAMEKGVTVAQIEAGVRRLRASGIGSGLFIQFGYPGEEAGDIEETLSLIDRLQPDDIGISVSYPLPGTPFHARVRAQIETKSHWRDSSDLAMLFHSPHSTRYYRALHAYTHARFRQGRALRAPGSLLGRRGIDVLRYSIYRYGLAALLQIVSGSRRAMSPLAPALERDQAALPVPQTLAD
jgi:anaerobic magnesium-protoporphyrin IX monomethyl ester cyclase